MKVRVFYLLVFLASLRAQANVFNCVTQSVSSSAGDRYFRVGDTIEIDANDPADISTLVRHADGKISKWETFSHPLYEVNSLLPSGFQLSLTARVEGFEFDTIEIEALPTALGYRAWLRYEMTYKEPASRQVSYVYALCQKS